jgi:hypothetical protein
VWNGRISTGKDLEGNGHGLIKVLYWHLPEGNEETHEKPVRLGPDAFGGYMLFPSTDANKVQVWLVEAQKSQNLKRLLIHLHVSCSTSASNTVAQRSVEKWPTQLVKSQYRDMAGNLLAQVPLWGSLICL